MKLIVGLGNPGKKYENTRHNIGFIFIDHIAKVYNSKFKEKFDGLYCECNIDGEKVLLLKPQTYMNLSGTSVKKIMDFYKISNEDVLLIYDDLALEFGKVKLKINSSAGGHNGVKDIIAKLGTKEILRVKYGILNSFKKDTKDFVLSNFSKEESIQIINDNDLIQKIVEDFAKLEFLKYPQLLNKYN